MPRPASWQRRLIGYLIDSLIIFAVTSALWIRLFISFGNRMSNTLNAYPRTATAAAQAAIGRVFSTTLGPFLVELVFTMALAVLYYWVLTGNWGTTIGKRCVSARVVPAAGGTRPGLGASLVRAVVFVVCAPILPLFLVDNLWLFAGGRRRCLHDRAARTIVVRDRPAP
ncbi:MAG: RDD family protein [Streptosporangiaceae bacterium]